MGPLVMPFFLFLEDRHSITSHRTQYKKLMGYLEMGKQARVMPCSLCKKTGHNKSTCPTKDTKTVFTKKKKTVTQKTVTQKTANATVTTEMAISQFLRFIATVDNGGIVLLRQKEVVQWLFGDLSFLPAIEKKNKSTDEARYKVLEDRWGQAVLKMRRPDLKLDKQWTNKFGEHLCEEMYALRGQTVSKPAKKEHYQPDLEVADAILEVKTGTFHTAGTAGEKILGCPFKYAEIPALYDKPLKILCLGGAEKACRESYGNLPGAKCSLQKNKFLQFFRENQIEYVGASDLLLALL